LGVAVGEKGAPCGLLEAIWAQRKRRGSGYGEGVVVVEVPRCEGQASRRAHLTLPNLGGLPGRPETGLDGAAMILVVVVVVVGGSAALALRLFLFVWKNLNE
jgi:hypothetical protein